MSAKVVDHPSRDAPPSAAPLTRCRDIIIGRAAGFLEELLLVLDDELFALAESARSDRTQQQFFDAMRTIRLAREQICARFIACLQAPAPAAMEDAASGSGENTPLSLLENDALEQRIAVTTMSQRVEREHELQLTLLRVRVRRLETQCGTHDVAVRIEPHHFAHGFATAVRPLELESDIRLIQFKRFEQGAFSSANSSMTSMACLRKRASCPTSLQPRPSALDSQMDAPFRDPRPHRIAQHKRAMPSPPASPMLRCYMPSRATTVDNSLRGSQLCPASEAGDVTGLQREQPPLSPDCSWTLQQRRKDASGLDSTPASMSFLAV